MTARATDPAAGSGAAAEAAGNGTLGADMAPDAEIIEAVLRGDTERYGELVERYQLAAWKLAFGFVGNAQDAQELAQNGFVQAYLRLRQFRGASRFSTWLYRIIANECKDFFRAKSRRPDTLSLSVDNAEGDSVPFELADPAGDPRGALESREMAVRITQAVGRLPMNQRAAFILRRLNGLSVEEVAEVMGCRPGTVKAHLSRAAETLRGQIEPFLKTEVHR